MTARRLLIGKEPFARADLNGRRMSRQAPPTQAAARNAFIAKV